MRAVCVLEVLEPFHCQSRYSLSLSLSRSLSLEPEAAVRLVRALNAQTFLLYSLRPANRSLAIFYSFPVKLNDFLQTIVAAKLLGFAVRNKLCAHT